MSVQVTSTHPWVAEARRGIRFGIISPAPQWSAFRERAQMVEALGFDSLWLPDHPLLGATWATLAALAEATHTIRLGALVSCVSYRHPVILARDVAEVDRISNGRAVLGLGSGDMPWEFQQMGLAYPPVRQRQVVLEKALQVVPALLRGETVTHAGTQFQLNGAALALPAVQQPRVPILVAGGGPRTTLRFVAQYADACNLGAASWAGGDFTAVESREKLEVLRRHCVDLRRDPESVLRTCHAGALLLAETEEAAQAKLAKVLAQTLSFFEQLLFAGTPEGAVQRLRALVEAGFEYLIPSVLPFDFDESLQLLAQRVMPAVVAA
jgi:alkanesulfonate monooxygenase SsuD/methylene tetrahydromethanopterin reductase-like flavin-dependent oxidoreductase (luciferase family)